MILESYQILMNAEYGTVWQPCEFSIIETELFWRSLYLFSMLYDVFSFSSFKLNYLNHILPNNSTKWKVFSFLFEPVMTQ